MFLLPDSSFLFFPSQCSYRLASLGSRFLSSSYLSSAEKFLNASVRVIFFLHFPFAAITSVEDSGHVANWGTRYETLGPLLRVSRLAELQRLDCATCSYSWSIWYYPCVAGSQYCRVPGRRILLSYGLFESSELSPYGMDPGSGTGCIAHGLTYAVS